MGDNNELWVDTILMQNAEAYMNVDIVLLYFMMLCSRVGGHKLPAYALKTQVVGFSRMFVLAYENTQCHNLNHYTT